MTTFAFFSVSYFLYDLLWSSLLVRQLLYSLSLPSLNVWWQKVQRVSASSVHPPHISISLLFKNPFFTVILSKSGIKHPPPFPLQSYWANKMKGTVNLFLYHYTGVESHLK